MSEKRRVRSTGERVRILAAAALGLSTTLALTAPQATAISSFAAYDPDDAWWFKAMKIAKVHEDYTGKGVKVAVIDGSIDLDVPELEGADITLGAAVGGGRSESVPGAGAANHGTAMTVLVAGQGNGGVTGLAPDAEVTFYQGNTDPYEDRLGSTEDLVEQAVEDGADIISLSMSGGGQIAWESAVQKALDAGVVLVAGAGQAGLPNIGQPAQFPGVVAVGAIDRDLQPWSEQPGQSENALGALTVVAPGVEVPAGASSTDRTGATWTPAFARTGTSPATAITAGALALVKDKYPDATGNQLIQHLIHVTGRGGDELVYEWRKPYGFGLVGLSDMLERDPRGWPDENPLLNGVGAALEDYPLDVYRDPDAPATEPPADDDPTPAAAPSDETGAGTTPWLVGAVVVVVLAGTGAAITIRRRRRPDRSSRS